VSHTHSFGTSDTGHTQLPHQVLSDGYVMTDDGHVFPVDMFPQEMERCKKSMILTGSVFTKHEPLYDVPGGQAPGGCRAERKKKRTTTSGGSTSSGKATLTKSRKSSGVGIAKALDFSDQRPTFVVAGCVRALKVLTSARRTAS
jgi:hypothetical protein